MPTIISFYKIANIIEEKHPEPSVPLNTPVQLRFRKVLMDLIEELTLIYIPGVAQRFNDSFNGNSML